MRKVIIKNYKKIISWFLVMAVVFTGVSWPSFSSFADDATAELGTTKFDADATHPYMMMVIDKYEDSYANGDETVTGIVTDIYAIKSNVPLNYMSDYKLVVTEEKEEGLETDEEGYGDVLYYKWNDDLKAWESDFKYGIYFNKDFNRSVLFAEVEYDEDSGDIIDVVENKASYILEKDFTKLNFDINTYPNGIYVVGYDSFTSHKDFVNKNYLEYDEDSSVGNAEITEMNKFYFSDLFVKNNIYSEITEVTSLLNASGTNKRAFDYTDIKIGDTFVLPSYVQMSVTDSIMTGNQTLNMMVDYSISNVYLLNGTSVNVLNGASNCAPYAKITGSNVSIGSNNDSVWNNDSFIVEITAKTSLSGTASSGSHSLFILVNTANSTILKDKFDSLTKLSNTQNQSYNFISFINAVNSNYFTDRDMVVSSVKALNRAGIDSKDLNKFRIYNILENNYFDKTDFSTLLNGENIDFVVSEVGGIDSLNTIPNLEDYIEIVYNNEYGYYEVQIDANEITNYRRDSRNSTAFEYVIIEGTLRGQNYNKSSFKINLDVVQYSYGEGGSNVIPNNQVIRVAKIEFSSALTPTYAPMLTNLKFMNFANTYQTLINYSDYQLLFYTDAVPLLENNHYLSFDKAVNIEIYKNTNGVWEFYNYLKDVENVMINLPQEAGYRSIEFNSYILMNKVTNQQVLAANDVDEYYNMQLRGSKLPANYLNGGSNSIYSNKDGYNYYYVFRKGQNTYFMYKTNTPIESSGELLVIPTDKKTYALTQNLWIPCSEGAAVTNGFNFGFLDDFNNYLLYTNDSNFGKPIPNSQIGAVDYFKYIPNFASTNGYDYIIAETSDNLVAIQWKGATLKIRDGLLYFDNATSDFDITTRVYSEFAWSSDKNQNSGIIDGYFRENGIVGSMIYSSVDIYDYASNVKVFSTGYSNSSIVIEEMLESDYACTYPTLKDVSNLVDVYEYAPDGVNADNILLQEVGNLYYAYFVPMDHTLYYDNTINITNADKDNDIYTELRYGESLEILKLVFDKSTNSWKYDSKETVTQTDSNETTKMLFCHNLIDWFGMTVTCINDPDRDIKSKDVVFAGDIVSDSLKDFEYVDISGNLVSHSVVNGAFIAGSNKFAQYVDDYDNYWILVSKSFEDIYDPTETMSKFEVGKADSEIEFTLYAPLYSSYVEVLSAKGNGGGLISYGNGRENLYTNSNDWYSGNDSNDEGNPFIDTIYVVNNKIKIKADDIDEYQMTFYADEEYERFIEQNGRVYEKILPAYYDTIEYTVVNGVASKLLINGHCYELKDTSFTIDKTNSITVNGKESYYVLANGEKIARREVINSSTYVVFVKSGIYQSYMKVIENGVIFEEDVTIMNNGVTQTISTGNIVPVGSVILFAKGYIPVPEQEHEFEFYTEDKFGNISKVETVSVGKASNNSIIFGNGNEDIRKEIEDAIAESKNDTLPPNIYYGYIYKGTLHLGIKDVAPEGVTPSGLSKDAWSSFIKYTDFVNKNDPLNQNITIINEQGSSQVIDVSSDKFANRVIGDLLDGSNVAWLGVIGEGLKITGNTSKFELIKDSNGKIQTGQISLGARDANFNESEVVNNVTVSEELNNSILFGAANVPVDIIEMLQNAKDEEGKEDDNINSKPIIDAVYVLNGILYVEAHDNDGAIAEYGFQWKYISTMAENFTGKVATYNSNDVLEQVIESTTIKAGDTIKAKTICYKHENFMAIKIPTAITIHVVDDDGNVTKRTIYPTNNNQIIYGDVSDVVKDYIESAGGEVNPPSTNSYPVITSVYTYQGYIYVEGYANDGLHAYSYGFKADEDSIYPGRFEGYDILDNYISITSGRIVSKGTKIFKNTNYQKLNFPTRLTVSIRDVNGDETALSFNVQSDNTLLYGEPPILPNGDTLEDGRPDDKPEEPEDPSNPEEPEDPDDGQTPGDTDGDGDPDITDPDDDGDGIPDSKDPDKDTDGDGDPDVTDPDDDGDGIPDIYDPDDDGDGIPDTDDPDHPDYEVPDDGTSEDEGDSDSNVRPETESTPGIILPDKELEQYNWYTYDYVLQLLDRNTQRVVYSIRLDTAEAIEIPKLQDSTVYIYKQLVVNEYTEEIVKTITGKYSSLDTIAPIITKVWFNNYRLYVSAYDIGGLADEPYLFNILGTPVTNTKYSANNNIRVVYNDKVQITVKDMAGNATTVTVAITKDTKDVLYECVNPKNAVFVKTNTSKTSSYWLAYLQTIFEVDVKGFKVDETNCSNLAFTEEDGEIKFDFVNDGVLTFYNKEINKYYALSLRTLNAGKSYRTIIVQEGSETDFCLAFERKLMDVFGTTDGITWATDDSGVLSRNSSMILANNVGVARIVASKNGVSENFYVVVGEKISTIESTLDFGLENFAYTYLVRDKIDLVKALQVEENMLKYVVLDSSTSGVSKKDNTLSVNSSGKQTFVLLDVVNDEMLEYTFEAVLVAPFISNFTDIIGSSNRADIEYLCERGIISQYPDYKYKTSNKMTTKEFLTMLNRIRLTYDTDFVLDKQDKEINLNEKDFDYYSSMNILSNLTETEVFDILNTYTLNKAITFEEVVALISKTLLYDEYHTQDGYECPPGLEDVSSAAIHLLTMGIINEDDARNGTREVTKAEIAYMLAETIRFLEY